MTPPSCGTRYRTLKDAHAALGRLVAALADAEREIKRLNHDAASWEESHRVAENRAEAAEARVAALTDALTDALTEIRDLKYSHNAYEVARAALSAAEEGTLTERDETIAKVPEGVAAQDGKLQQGLRPDRASRSVSAPDHHTRQEES